MAKGALASCALALAAGCRQVVKPDDTGGARGDDSDKGEVDEMRDLAARLGLDLRDAEARADAAGVGLRTKEALLSRRFNSRTFFAQDQRRKGTAFAGSDEELLKQAERVLEQLGVPHGEVAKAAVLQEMTQASPRREGPVEGQPQKDRRMVLIERQVTGLPVFGSHFKLSVGKDGGIELMELHWPELPSAAVREARRLAFKVVMNEFKPPDLAHARPESVEAGILHSSAYGNLLEVQPVIRVVYATTGRNAGKKPVLYLDRDGKPAPMPRQIEVACEPPAPPRAEPGRR
jgi:hypothetical protein